jgi:protein tyrosine/serine phosphatase
MSRELVRANQPWPFQLRAWRDQGIRTVINLRGGFGASFYALEKAACADLGLTLVNFTIASRDVPTKAQVRGARTLFETVDYPALMHCKSGADRAGIMAVFYRHFREGRPIAEARTELSPRYLHVKAGLTGVLDYVLERYLAEGERNGLSFLDWVESPAYEPARIKADFRAGWWGTLLSDKLLRRE